MANTDPKYWFLPSGDISRDPTYTSDNEAIVFVDGEEYFNHLAAQLRKMSVGNELFLAAWRVTPEVFLEPLTSVKPPKFVDEIKALIKKGVITRTMLWYVFGTYIARFKGPKILDHPKGNLDFTKAVIAATSKQPGTGILDERLISKFSSHHQKFAVLQTDAAEWWSYVGGIDICLDRWDTQKHSSPPERQKEFLDGWHDIQCALRGHAVAQVWDNFKQRWNDRTPTAKHPSPLPTTPPPKITSKAPTPVSAGTQHVQLLRTLVCRGIYPFAPRGEQTARMAYERAIARAEHYIYIEEQYLWPCRVVNKLRDAIAKNKDLKVIIVLARDYDLPAPLDSVHYEMRDEAIRTIRGRSKNQLFVYHLEQPSTKKAIYVHSKIMIVDDCYAAIGSMNVNKRSATTDSELHVGVVDGATVSGKMSGGRVTVCKFAKEFRIKLWKEHLGISNSALLDDPITAVGRWPDWSKSTRKRPSRVHHAVCHHSRLVKSTIADWISGLKALNNLAPSPYDKYLDEAIDKLEKLAKSKSVEYSFIYLFLDAVVWNWIKKLLRDRVLNIETTC